MVFIRFLARHWRGRLPLTVMLAGPVAASALGLWAFNRAFAYWPLPAMVLANLPVLAWAVVGAFRTADGELREGRGFVAGFAGYAGAAAVLLAAGTTLVARQSPVRTITAGMLPEAEAAPVLPEEAGRITLAGGIGHDQFRALETRLAREPAPTAVLLDSEGGNVFAARGLARLIEEAGLETHVIRRCYSACTLVFAAGARRSMAEGAEMGFHGYLLRPSSSYGAVRHVDTGEAQEKDRAFFLRRGIAPDFVARIHEAPPDALWRPSRAELRAAGMLTAD